MTKQRLFFLDFIRAISVIMILVTHYNALWLYNISPVKPTGGVFSTYISNIYIGGLGVALFFTISGCSLMYTYGDKKIQYSQYLKKRVLRLFPMFYIAYAVAFLFQLETNNGLWTHLPWWKWIFTFTGMDGLAISNGISTFYLLGEWFLGVIILIYLIFPILLKMLNKFPKKTITFIFFLYFLTLALFPSLFNAKIVPTLVLSTTLTVYLPEVFFGMVFIKYFKKVNLPVFIIALLIVVGNQILKPAFIFLPKGYETIPAVFQTTYVGIAYFLILVYLAEFFNRKKLRIFVTFFSNQSYAIFLVHHVIIYDVMWHVMAETNLAQLSILKEYYYFIEIFIIVTVFAFALTSFEKWLMGLILKKQR